MMAAWSKTSHTTSADSHEGHVTGERHLVSGKKKLKFDFPFLVLGIWGRSRRAREHYPREYNLFVPSMVSEDSVVLKYIEAATLTLTGHPKWVK